MAEIYLAKEMKPEEKPREDAEKSIALTADQLNGRIGTYLNSDDDQVLRLSVQNGKLRVSRGSGEESYELKALSEDQFRPLAASVDLTFEKAKPGGSQEFLLNKRGRPA